MAVIYATVSRAAAGLSPKRKFSFYPMTGVDGVELNIVTIAAENYEHAGPYEVTTSVSGAFSIQIPTDLDQGGDALIWKIVETPVDKIPGRAKNGLAPAVIGYATINASIGYDDLIENLVEPLTVTPELIVSVSDLVSDAENAAGDAEGSALTADEHRQAAEAAAAAAEAPTDTMVATLVANPASESAAVLSATYGTPLSASLNDAAFDALLASLDPGARVFIPEGVTIELDDGHTLTQPVTIDGPGRILDTRVAPTTSLFTLGPAASGTKILCRITGSVSNTYIEGHNAIYIAGTDNGAGVAPTYVTDVVIDSPRISGFGRLAVRGTFVEDSDITIGEVHTTGHGGAVFYSATNVNVHIPHLHDIGPGPVGGETYGIQFSRQDDADDLVRYPRSTNCHGHIDVARDAPAMNMLGTHGGQGISLTFGSAYGIKRVIDIVPLSGDAGTELYAPKDVSFFGQYADSGVTDGSGGEGVNIAGAYASSAVVEYARGISGHIDVLRGYGNEDDALSGAVYCRTTQGLSITFGTIIEPSPRAIHLYHTNLDFTVGVGSVIDAWSNTLAEADFIAFTNNTNKGNVTHLSGSRGSKSATKVNTRGVVVIAAAHANTRIRLGAAVDATAATSKVSGNVTGIIPWDVAQMGVVVNGTLTALLYAGNILMSAGQKITTAATAAGGAGFQVQAGTRPTSSNGGDLWLVSGGSGGLEVNIGGYIRRVFTGYEKTVTLDFGSIAAGATAELTVTVQDALATAGGVVAGDIVTLGRPTSLAVGVRAEAWVSATDTVTISLYNSTGSAVDPASASWKVRVLK